MNGRLSPFPDQSAIALDVGKVQTKILNDLFTGCDAPLDPDKDNIIKDQKKLHRQKPKQTLLNFFTIFPN